MKKEYSFNELMELEHLLEQRRMHYDNLLWKITSIFVIAIGGLLVYVFKSDNPEQLIIIFGFLLTVLILYLASSFRLYRHNTRKTEIYKNLIMHDKSLIQWELYISIFLIMELLWLFLLKEKISFLLWVGLLIFGILATLCLWFIAGGKKSLKDLFEWLVSKL